MRIEAKGMLVSLAIVVACVVAFSLAGCALPKWTIFQKKVPTELSDKPKAQAEGERRAAAYIRDRTKPPVADPSATVADVHQVASALSASIGEPEKPVKVEDQAAIIASLRAGLVAKERQLEQWKAFGRKYGGKELEETGINLAGPAGLVVLAGIIALCIACPAVGYILLRVLPLLWGFFSRVTSGVAEFTKENPEAAKELAATLSNKMDAAHKRLVRVRADAKRITNLLPADQSQ